MAQIRPFCVTVLPVDCGASAPNRNTAFAQTAANDARVVVKIIAEHPGDCPSDNLRFYTFVYIEGAGVPDANGYVIAKTHATTDITILNGQVLSLTPRHHEWQWDLPIHLERFPPVPMDGITPTHSLDVIFSALPPSTTPDVSCTYNGRAACWVSQRSVIVAQNFAQNRERLA